MSGADAVEFATLRLHYSPRACTVTIHRPEQQNSINGQLLEELHRALDQLEANSECRLVILEGQPGVFCTGMDFTEVAGNVPGVADAEKAEIFMSLLRRMSLSPKILIAKIDGKVTAGGVGLVAATDFAVATPRSQFSLSEALWGLLPACVVPYLIRRVGFQCAYWMTLSTLPFSAEEVAGYRLINQVSQEPDDVIRRVFLRLGCLDEMTLVDLKSYFRKMWIVTEEMERVAVAEITRLVTEPRVRKNIREFVEHQRFPWSPQ
jgi:polyketide biosynthesis enoyl-CoA hydratase PksH